MPRIASLDETFAVGLTVAPEHELRLVVCVAGLARRCGWVQLAVPLFGPLRSRRQKWRHASGIKGSGRRPRLTVILKLSSPLSLRLFVSGSVELMLSQ